MGYTQQKQGYVNRANGKMFEELLQRTCARYEFLGIAKIEKTPEPVKVLSKLDNKGQFKACFEKRAQPDFKGTMRKGVPVVFEAKHTDTGKMEKGRVTAEQLSDLKKHFEFGAMAFVLCSFGFGDFFCVPVVVWDNMEEYYGRKYVTAADLKQFSCQFIGGYVDFLGCLGGEE